MARNTLWERNTKVQQPTMKSLKDSMHHRRSWSKLSSEIAMIPLCPNVPNISTEKQLSHLLDPLMMLINPQQDWVQQLYG